MGTIFGKRRGAAGSLAAALLTTFAIWGAPAAQAATCVSVPVSTIGTDVSLLGDRYRVPAVSGIRVCADGASTPLVAVETSGGSCSSGCLSVLLQGNDTDAGAVTIYYSTDGTSHSETVNPGGAGGGSDTCLLSVGSPDAPYPNCAVAIGPDGLPGGGDPLPDVPGCETVPDVYDENGNPTGFCDDPAGWIRTVVNAVRAYCDAGNCSAAGIRCIVLGDCR